MDLITALLFALLGLFGGLFRALLGIRKEFERAKQKGNFEMHWGLFVTTLIIGAMIGFVSQLAPGSNLLLAFSAGYLGDDAIHGLIPH